MTFNLLARDDRGVFARWHAENNRARSIVDVNLRWREHRIRHTKWRTELTNSLSNSSTICLTVYFGELLETFSTEIMKVRIFTSKFYSEFQQKSMQASYEKWATHIGELWNTLPSIPHYKSFQGLSNERCEFWLIIISDISSRPLCYAPKDYNLSRYSRERIAWNWKCW